MAKYDRCSICDYSEAEGSSFAGKEPGSSGKVTLIGGDYLCDQCNTAVKTNVSDLGKDD